MKTIGRKSKISVNIGGGFSCESFLLDSCKANPRFRFSVYDAPLPKLDGGRVNKSVIPMSVRHEIIREFNQNGIGFNFVMTSQHVTEEDLKSRQLNDLLRSFRNGKNKVILQNELLRRYVRDCYPEYQLIYSVTHGVVPTDKKFYEEALKRYDIVVLSPELNRDAKFLSEVDTSRIEALVNESCIPNCPLRKDHYFEISKLNHDACDQPAKDTYVRRFYANCPAKKNPGVMMADENTIREMLCAGITDFKISGRITRVTQNNIQILDDALRTYVRMIELGEENTL